MFKILRTRLSQGHRTIDYPLSLPVLPQRYRGRLAVDPAKCQAGCTACKDVCPTGAIDVAGGVKLDLGRCVFCGDCVAACPSGAVAFTSDHRMATDRRGDLVLSGEELKLADGMGGELRKKLGRSLKLRQVSAGGCNACELDINVLNTVGWDLSRFGIQFVASPRHADGIVVTGPVTGAMRQALLDTFDAIPAPKIVIAVGACATGGGLYRDTGSTAAEASKVLPIDLFIPGCPPHPLTILDGLLRFIGTQVP